MTVMARTKDLQTNGKAASMANARTNRFLLPMSMPPIDSRIATKTYKTANCFVRVFVIKSVSPTMSGCKIFYDAGIKMTIFQATAISITVFGFSLIAAVALMQDWNTHCNASSNTLGCQKAIAFDSLHFLFSIQNVDDMQ